MKKNTLPPGVKNNLKQDCVLFMQLIKVLKNKIIIIKLLDQEFIKIKKC